MPAGPAAAAAGARARGAAADGEPAGRDGRRVATADLACEAARAAAIVVHSAAGLATGVQIRAAARALRAAEGLVRSAVALLRAGPPAQPAQQPAQPAEAAPAAGRRRRRRRRRGPAGDSAPAVERVVPELVDEGAGDLAMVAAPEHESRGPAVAKRSDDGAAVGEEPRAKAARPEPTADLGGEWADEACRLPQGTPLTSPSLPRPLPTWWALQRPPWPARARPSVSKVPLCGPQPPWRSAAGSPPLTGRTFSQGSVPSSGPASSTTWPP